MTTQEITIGQPIGQVFLPEDFPSDVTVDLILNGYIIESAVPVQAGPFVYVEYVPVQPGDYELGVNWNGETLLFEFVVLAQDTGPQLDADGFATPAWARQFLEQLAVDDGPLQTVLNIAKAEVLAYAPALAEDETVPLGWALAQVEHAQDILNASRVNPASGDLGDGSFALQAFPMSWSVKTRIRPKTGVVSLG